jgi:hypothetical protein
MVPSYLPTGLKALRWAIAEVVLALTILAVPSAHAQSKPQASASSPVSSSAPVGVAKTAASDADPLDALERWRRMLADERAVLERQADRQYAGLEKLAERGIWVGGVLMAIALGWIFWFFGKTKNETRATVKEMFEQQAKQVLDAEAALMREQYELLRAEVAELASYKSRKVVWVAGAAAMAGNEKLMPAIDRVVSVLHSAGISNIARAEPTQGTPFSIGDADLVVLTFDGSDESRWLLTELVSELKAKAPPVPLLIYTHTPGGAQVSLGEADVALLDDFDWYVPVNFPAQLVAQVQVLLRRTRSLLSSELSYG